MDVSEGIAAAIVPEGNELLGLADAGGERDTAALVAGVAGQGQGGQRIAAGQDEEGLGLGESDEAAAEAQRVLAANPRAAEVERAPFQREQFRSDLDGTAGGDCCERRGSSGGVPQARKGITDTERAIALAGLEPVLELGQRGGLEGELFEVFQLVLGMPAGILDADAVGEGLAGRGVAGERSVHPEPAAEEGQVQEGKEQEGGEEKKGLVAVGLFDVGGEERSGREGDQEKLARRREAPTDPGDEAPGAAVEAVEQRKHGLTGWSIRFRIRVPGSSGDGGVADEVFDDESGAGSGELALGIEHEAVGQDGHGEFLHEVGGDEVEAVEEGEGLGGFHEGE